ncbi:MAG: MFS transporter [Sulfolobaceae archaeon]
MKKQTIAGRLERIPWTSFHTKLLVLLAIGEFFDLYDLFAGGFVVTQVAKYYGISIPTSVFYTVAISFLGAFVGVILLNLIADSIGRRTALLINMFIMSIAYLLTPFSPNVLIYGALRFIAGVGYGPEALIVIDIMTTEFFPAKIRGRALSIAYTMAWTSPLVVAGLAYGLSSVTQPLLGWQWLFIIGGLGIITILPFRFLIPESPRWLEARGRIEEAEKIVSKIERIAEKEKGPLPPPEELEVITSYKIPFKTLFEKEYIKRTIMLWIFEFFQTGVYYGFTSLAPTVLYEKGFTIAKSLEMSVIIYSGYFIGSLISIFIIDNKAFDRKWQIALIAFLMGIDGLAFGYSTSVALLIITGFIFGTLANIFSNAFHMYGAELYPTRVRAFADGVQYSLSRLGNFVWLTVLPIVLVTYGPFAMFTLVFTFSVIILLDIGILGPRASQIEVEKLSK